MLISSLLRDKDFPTVMGANIDEEMFRSYPDEFHWIRRYFEKYHRMPTKMAFKNKFPDFIIAPVNDTAMFCDEVRNGHIQHRLLSSIKDVTDLIGDGDIEHAVKFIQSEVVKIAAETTGTGDTDIITDWQMMFDEAADTARRVAEGGIAGIPSGMESFDYETGGYQPGALHVIAGRLTEGKSWVLALGASAALQSDCTVQYDTLEMTKSQVGFRMHGLLSGAIGKELFSNLELQRGHNFDPKKYREFLRSLRNTLGGSLFVTDGNRGRISAATVAAQIERNKPQIVFIDYITLMEGAIGGDWKNIAQISGELKSLAQQYNIPVVVAAQLNRQLGLSKEPPGPEAIAQSDAIGQDADTVVTIKKMSTSVLALRLVKNRHGSMNPKWYMDFRPGNGIFREVTYDTAMDLKDRDDQESDEPRRVPREVKARTIDGTPIHKSAKKRVPVRNIKKSTTGKRLQRSS